MVLGISVNGKTEYLQAVGFYDCFMIDYIGVQAWLMSREKFRSKQIPCLEFTATPKQLQGYSIKLRLNYQTCSVAAMILYERGHFQLDDPISKWIPEFLNMHVYVCYHY